MTGRWLSMVLVLGALPCSAYELTKDRAGDPARWKRSITVVLDAHAAQQLGEPRLEEGIRAAIDTLNRGAVGIELELTTGTPVAQGYDTSADAVNQNDIEVLEDWPFDEHWLATTRLTLDSRTGEILDADILLNGEDVEFRVLPSADASSGGQRRQDVQNTLTHELGHLLGLAHNTADAKVVMYPTAQAGETIKRVLADDDRAGLVFLYGAPLAVSPEPTPTVGCSSTSSGVTPLLALLVLAALRIRRSAVVAALVLPAIALASDPAPRVPNLQEAEVVMAGRVVTTHSSWATPGVIATDVELVRGQCLVGPCEERMVVRVQGGRVGDLEQLIAGAPVPQPGDPLVVVRVKRRVRVFRVAEQPTRAALVEAVRRAGLPEIVPELLARVP